MKLLLGFYFFFLICLMALIVSNARAEQISHYIGLGYSHKIDNLKVEHSYPAYEEVNMMKAHGQQKGILLEAGTRAFYGSGLMLGGSVGINLYVPQDLAYGERRGILEAKYSRKSFSTDGGLNFIIGYHKKRHLSYVSFGLSIGKRTASNAIQYFHQGEYFASLENAVIRNTMAIALGIGHEYKIRQNMGVFTEYAASFYLRDAYDISAIGLSIKESLASHKINVGLRYYFNNF